MQVREESEMKKEMEKKGNVCIGWQQKKGTIGPPKHQFLSKTFVVGGLFHSGFSPFFRFEKF